MRRILVGLIAFAVIALAWGVWLKRRPVQPLRISRQIASHLPEGEFVSEIYWQGKTLAFADLDGDGLGDKVVVDEKCVSPVKMKALLRIYWGDGRGRETLGEVAYLWSDFSFTTEPLFFLADLDGDGQKEIVSFLNAPNHLLALTAWKFDRQREKVRQVSQIVTDAPFSTNQTEVVDLGRDGREEVVTFSWGVEHSLRGFLIRKAAKVWIFGWDEQKVWWRKRATFWSKSWITLFPLAVPVMRVTPQLTMMSLRATHADFFALPVEVEGSRWNWQGLCFSPDWQYTTLLLQAVTADPSRWRLVAELPGKPMKVADLDGDGTAELIAFDVGWTAFDDSSVNILRVDKGKVEVAVLRGKGKPEVLLPHQPNGQLFVRWERSQWQQVALQ